jgi:hypothetical protein
MGVGAAVMLSMFAEVMSSFQQLAIAAPLPAVKDRHPVRVIQTTRRTSSEERQLVVCMGAAMWYRYLHYWWAWFVAQKSVNMNGVLCFQPALCAHSQSVEATRRMRALAADTEAVGAKTIGELQDQGGVSESSNLLDFFRASSNGTNSIRIYHIRALMSLRLRLCECQSFHTWSFLPTDPHGSIPRAKLLPPTPPFLAALPPTFPSPTIAITSLLHILTARSAHV